jgi:hypothetical protein
MDQALPLQMRHAVGHLCEGGGIMARLFGKTGGFTRKND